MSVWHLRASAFFATSTALAQACGGAAVESAPPAVEPASPYAPSAAGAIPDSAPSPAAAGEPIPQSTDTAGKARTDKLLVTESEYQGWKYYAVYCERCHGPDALGTVDAPDLRFSVSEDGAVSADSFRVVVLKGAENREENKVMKGFEGLLDDQRIGDVYAYIKARSEGRLAAGRPHRASGQ